ncbi:MAG: hypothetical protein ABIO55_06760 [Ginsengibacter sp.]
MMFDLITIFLNSVLTQIQQSMSPALFEVLKVVAVAFGWIGGLTLFMLRKDKRKQQANA